MARRAKAPAKRGRTVSNFSKVPSGELLTLLDFVRYAVSRFVEAKLVFAHGTTDPVAEAAFLVCETLHLHPDQLETFATARVTAREAKAILGVPGRPRRAQLSAGADRRRGYLEGRARCRDAQYCRLRPWRAHQIASGRSVRADRRGALRPDYFQSALCRCRRHGGAAARMPSRAETRARWRRRRTWCGPPHLERSPAAPDITGRTIVRDRPWPRVALRSISAIAATVARYRGFRGRSVLGRRRRSVNRPVLKPARMSGNIAVRWRFRPAAKLIACARAANFPKRKRPPCWTRAHAPPPSTSRTTSLRTGCHLPPTGPSRRRRDCSPAPRTCITSPSTAARSSTPRRVCGAPMRVMAAPRFPRRSPSRPKLWTMPRRSSSAFPRPSSSQAALPSLRPPDWITYFSAIPGRKPPIPRSRSRWPIIRSRAKARAPA